MRRIVGGASLLYDLDHNRATDRFHDSAHGFQEKLAQRRADAGDWRKVREAFEDARRSIPRRDARLEFVLSHLERDVARADGLLAGGGFPASGGAEGQHELLRGETCVGTKPGPRPCPAARQDVTFRVPGDVSVIRRITGEWRDYGQNARAQVFVNGQLVWQTDVGHDWDPDGRDVEVRVPRGSKITLRSSTGDPLWVRRLELRYLREPGYR